MMRSLSEPWLIIEHLRTHPKVDKPGGIIGNSAIFKAQGLLAAHACALGATLNQKAESAVPTNSPPEGNTTFIGGVTWCIALPGIAQSDLQKALDWACGPGGADCSQVQPGGLCFEPDTLLSHASYAFNSYYQQNGNSDIACNFGRTATITKKNPSYWSCNYLSSEQSSANSLLYPRIMVLKKFGISLLFYLAVL